MKRIRISEKFYINHNYLWYNLVVNWNKGEVYETKEQKNRKNTSVDCEYYDDFSGSLNVYGIFSKTDGSNIFNSWIY